jgi:hypothetical protein
MKAKADLSRGISCCRGGVAGEASCQRNDEVIREGTEQNARDWAVQKSVKALVPACGKAIGRWTTIQLRR